MISSIFLILTRLTQLLFLIPMIGMLSYLIHGYVQDNLLTPTFILVLFIVSVLAGVWALGTVLFYAVAKKAGWFMALIDLGIFAALIGGVAVLRGITGLDCSNVNPVGYWGLRETPFIYQLGKVCGLLKASFAFAIIEVLLFFWSFLLCLLVQHHWDKDHPASRRRETTYYESSRRGGSQRGGSRSRDYRSTNYDSRGSRAGSQRGGSRSGSRVRSGSRARSGSRYDDRRYDSRRSYV